VLEELNEKADQPQTPRMQRWPAGHALPHVPQFRGSNCTDVHIPAHIVAPIGHTHTPALHDDRNGQAVPHAPQLRASLVRFTQLVPHIVVPAGQLDAQAPVTQN
jgi:hypothetical protein